MVQPSPSAPPSEDEIEHQERPAGARLLARPRQRSLTSPSLSAAASLLIEEMQGTLEQGGIRAECESK